MDIDIHVQHQPEQAKQSLPETTVAKHAANIEAVTKSALHVSTQEPYAPSSINGNSQPQESAQVVNTTDSGANLNLNGSQRSSSSSLDTSSSCPSDLSKELGFSTDNHVTPNGSMTSMSLTSPLSQTKSSSPSTQLNNTLTTASARLERDADIRPLPKVRPRSSIPTGIPAATYAQQCVIAAYSSRLNPYALHRGEQELLQDHLCHLHVTTYLNIRNGILRLWTRNPMLSVTEEEALGCARDSRWMSLAAVSYNWLVRNGYINFGCVDVPKTLSPPKRGRRKEGPTIVVVGAGMAGLGCARQLQSLFEQYCSNTLAPKIVLLEGRKRIGGRIYSHPLQSLTPHDFVPGLRPTAEMGAHIIVGFDHGNPLDPIIRAQLALRYHLLRDISTIYDVDGTPVNEIQDAMAEKLYNDILDRSGAYRHKAVVNSTAEGDRQLIDSGREYASDDGVTIRQYEDAAASGMIGTLLPATRLRKGVGHKTADIKPRVGPPLSELHPTQEHSAASACQAMGWKLKDGVSSSSSFSLDQIAKASEHQTLGLVMDEGIKEYQKLLDLSPKDMRLLNWHFANLEYANAASVGKLSLSGWDQDMGNEFEGEHSQVIGGYQQLPRGLWCLPSKLDVRTNKAVSKVVYNAPGSTRNKTRVHCEDGEVIHADKVIFTAPLGVLKEKSVEFDPPLPEWKTGAIERLGFGLLNKVILVFEKPFWDVERDMFGLLREPTAENSLSQDDYAPGRGQFYLFWNCMKTSGLPMLIALMAGDSAHRAESLSDAEILGEVTSQLRNVFKETAIPDPLETIITRWKRDRFAHGSYSYVAADALPGDYDVMARPIGNLYFAGEATCGTHPATVHGAYLSGLRAAREVLESVVGPIEVPSPLVPPKSKVSHITPVATPPKAAMKNSAPLSVKKRKLPQPNNLAPAVFNKPAPAAVHTSSSRSKESLQTAYEDAMWQVIFSELGVAEPSPRKLPLNPFLLYQKDYWFICKSKCDEARRASTGKADAKAPRDEVRQALGQMWREASEEIRKPYLERIEGHRRTNEENLTQWKERIAEWTKKTYEVKDRWCAENTFENFVSSVLGPADGGVEQGAAKKLKTEN